MNIFLKPGKWKISWKSGDDFTLAVQAASYAGEREE